MFLYCLVIIFICPVIFLMIGVIFSKFPPRKINCFYGYRTKRSMISQNNWDYSQKALGAIFIKISSIFLLVNIVLLYPYYIYRAKINLLLIVSLIVMVIQSIGTIISVFSIEKDLKKKEC